MKALIIEDEKLAAERMERQLSEVSIEIKVLAKLSSVRESLIWLSAHSEPDLIFLDIQLSDGHAFDILENYNLSTPIVFTTAFDQYAIRAFKHHGIAYLLKPFQVADIEEALKKLSEVSYQKNDQIALQEIIHKFSEKFQSPYKKRFFVKRKNEAFSIAIEDIAIFNHEDGIVMIYERKKERFHVKFSLDQLETLIDPKRFFRINRKQIVSIDHLTKIDTSLSSRIYLEIDCPRIDQPLVVSKHRTHEFRLWLDS